MRTGTVWRTAQHGLGVAGPKAITRIQVALATTNLTVTRWLALPIPEMMSKKVLLAEDPGDGANSSLATDVSAGIGGPRIDRPSGNTAQVRRWPMRRTGLP
jgi:hypothetical protein